MFLWEWSISKGATNLKRVKMSFARRATRKLQGNEGRVAEMWIKCQEGLHISPICFWHSEGWSIKKDGVPLDYRLCCKHGSE